MMSSWPVVAAAAALIVLSAVQAWLLLRLSRMVAASARVEEKVGHLADALSILTETSEAGFKAVAEELTRRASAAPALPASRARTPIARIRAAAKKGASIAEIAAAEQMSEGEVRLRLHLAEHAAASTRARAARIEAGAVDGGTVEAGKVGAREGAGRALRA